ncbi:MAG TPA: intradiol ring-cleavage dioxygenase [Burkholderiales bacterium]|nr:intradiol ring-cleavage dioxygenase [Burkholderiales bacterium]
MRPLERRRAAVMRRRLLAAGLGLPFLNWRTARAQRLPPTPACGAVPAQVTPPQTAGPFYTPHSPRRASLVEAGDRGPRLLLTGRVVTTDCRAISGALLDVWHCDAEGRYDNAGFRHRGHLFADASGRYRLETIVPGLYPGRTRHIHLRVQAPGGRPLTTQLYFPGEPGNATDGLWQRALEIALEAPAAGQPQAGHFDFVLDG